MRTARARTSVEKRFPGFPLVIAYLPSFLLSGKPGLVQNIQHSIEHYNKLLIDGKEAETDTRSISWTRGLKQRFSNREKINFKDGHVVPAIYRPFEKTQVFFGRTFNEYVNQMPRIFPTGSIDNRIIAATGIGASGGFSAYMVNILPDLNMMAAGAQCFPLYLYEETTPEEGLFATTDGETGLARRDAITDAGLAQFQAAYPGDTITKEDLFYYIYG
ncbi:type ISP restriction/modification enzyme, partial [Salibaculum sp.]|uniref:type ISP restriction/modification enzyme n=1 Tax=Salibaculum sp. TaxID=2855480 RepID=UPI002B45CACD